MGMTPAFHPRDPGSIPWVGEDFFNFFNTFLYISSNLVPNSWLMTA